MTNIDKLLLVLAVEGKEIPINSLTPYQKILVKDVYDLFYDAVQATYFRGECPPLMDDTRVQIFNGMRRLPEKGL
ncbi:MAG: hypothetical protein J6M02_06710 [Clostridia bacterium]|nr:hypothetical protein [Clostridia bacterium]